MLIASWLPARPRSQWTWITPGSRAPRAPPHPPQPHLLSLGCRHEYGTWVLTERSASSQPEMKSHSLPAGYYSRSSLMTFSLTHRLAGGVFPGQLVAVLVVVVVFRLFLNVSICTSCRSSLCISIYIPCMYQHWMLDCHFTSWVLVEWQKLSAMGHMKQNNH